MGRTAGFSSLPRHLLSLATPAVLDDVIREWDEIHGRSPQGSSWVNKLSWYHYERYIYHVGYRFRRLQFQDADWDEEFYQRFEDVLGRIPRSDLKRDYFLAVLEKPLDHAQQVQ